MSSRFWRVPREQDVQDHTGLDGNSICKTKECLDYTSANLASCAHQVCKMARCGPHVHRCQVRKCSFGTDHLQTKAAKALRCQALAAASGAMNIKVPQTAPSQGSPLPNILLRDTRRGLRQLWQAPRLMAKPKSNNARRASSASQQT